MHLSSKKRKSRHDRYNKWVEVNFSGAMRDLVHEYCKAPIVIYTGAGVSVGPPETADGKRYGLPTWLTLLRSLVDSEAVKEWPTDPWEAAELAVQTCGLEAFRKRLRAAVSQADNYTKNYGQLRGHFVSGAPTLLAAAAFCGKLTGRITNPGKPEPKRINYRSAANSRVHAVITANYDCFLESAVANIYRRNLLHPVTALGSSAASATRIPVFHIHGYVPHPFYQTEDRLPSVNRLVITLKDYEEVWNRADVFGTTMGPQIHYLRYFTVLFIGFSFSDKYVCKLLGRIRNDYLKHANRSHFALLSEREAKERGEEFYREIGVQPILYGHHSEIPRILGELYCAGLSADNIFSGNKAEADVVLPEVLVRVHHPTGRSYQYPQKAVWELVQRLRNESVAASAVRESKMPGTLYY